MYCMPCNVREFIQCDITTNLCFAAISHIVYKQLDGGIGLGKVASASICCVCVACHRELNNLTTDMTWGSIVQANLSWLDSKQKKNGSNIVVQRNSLSVTVQKITNNNNFSTPNRIGMRKINHQFRHICVQRVKKNLIDLWFLVKCLSAHFRGWADTNRLFAVEWK